MKISKAETDMAPNTHRPGLPNYIGPTEDFFMFIHHDEIMEWTYNIMDRVELYEKGHKPPNETDARMKSLLWVEPRILICRESKRAAVTKDYLRKRHTLDADYASKSSPPDVEYGSQCGALYADYTARCNAIDADVLLPYARKHLGRDYIWDEKKQCLIFPHK